MSIVECHLGTRYGEFGTKLCTELPGCEILEPSTLKEDNHLINDYQCVSQRCEDLVMQEDDVESKEVCVKVPGCKFTSGGSKDATKGTCAPEATCADYVDFQPEDDVSINQCIAIGCQIGQVKSTTLKSCHDCSQKFCVDKNNSTVTQQLPNDDLVTCVTDQDCQAGKKCDYYADFFYGSGCMLPGADHATATATGTQEPRLRTCEDGIVFETTMGDVQHFPTDGLGYGDIEGCSLLNCSWDYNTQKCVGDVTTTTTTPSGAVTVIVSSVVALMIAFM